MPYWQSAPLGRKGSTLPIGVREPFLRDHILFDMGTSSGFITTPPTVLWVAVSRRRGINTLNGITTNVAICAKELRRHVRNEGHG
jgi:hypothetical protein